MATEYIKGLWVKAPHENAPKYVVCKLSFKREEMIAFLQSKTDEWVNADIKSGDKGYYASVDNWKPSKDKASEVEKNQAELNNLGIDGIPF